MVLSRVQALKGLFLCEPLSMDKTFKVDEDLIAFERRMEYLQDAVLSKMDLSDAPLDDEDSESEEDVGDSSMDCETSISTEESSTADSEATPGVDDKTTEIQANNSDMDKFWDEQFTANPINFQVSPYVSRDVLTADGTGLELLSLTDSLSPSQKTDIATALEAPPKYKLVVLKSGSTLQQAEYVIRVSGISGAQEDLQTLQEGKWVTDNLLNMFLRKYVQEQIQGVHCYFICFMQMMLKEGKSGLIYDYNAVQDVASNIDGGLFNLQHLFVPINISDRHFIFLWVDFNITTITAYNSSGENHYNQIYLHAMRRYLHDEMFKSASPDQRPNITTTWKTQDMSSSSPRQQNGVDCGVFTLFSIYLLSRGVALTSTSYSQKTLTERKIRQSIAFLLLEANELPIDS